MPASAVVTSIGIITMASRFTSARENSQVGH
jgi:hypothetical protein